MCLRLSENRRVQGLHSNVAYEAAAMLLHLLLLHLLASLAAGLLTSIT
jgi:hypothetical protein